ncbi:transmembrane protein 207 [Anolis carolinensis]|uniref:transmembrane protein 207 n=1 Tax=Anolis carolinensis TaxID=28377 RepID=UPI00046266E9|nr:PREDICTED: transmembrane protein 207 [Anolis carolinensis]|eukprot:XP_008122953.1 PREDICTED: transmembrane protein 207 [Anolis carolinensis]
MMTWASSFWIAMWSLLRGWLLVLFWTAGGLPSAFAQPGSSATEGCESIECSISYEAHSFGAWYIWPCLSLLLAVVLLCLVACCLQWWLKRQGFLPSSRNPNVFVLSDTESVYENDAAPWMPPKIPLRLPGCEPSTTNPSCNMAPPSYDEIMKRDSNSGPGQEAAVAALD